MDLVADIPIRSILVSSLEDELGWIEIFAACISAFAILSLPRFPNSLTIIDTVYKDNI